MRNLGQSGSELFLSRSDAVKRRIKPGELKPDEQPGRPRRIGRLASDPQFLVGERPCMWSHLAAQKGVDDEIQFTTTGFCNDYKIYSLGEEPWHCADG